MGSFLTTRSRNERLWFINNKALEDAILGYAAKYRENYSVKLYALAIEGNHIQATALFPKENRASFMRDFNAIVARIMQRYVPEYDGGRFWARRYSSEMLPGDKDIEDYFFYTVLQAVQDRLVSKISDYPGYNCFHDAIWGIKRKFKVVDWGKYNDAKRYNRKVRIKDFTTIVTLEYERLPGYENLSQRDYAKLMQKKLEERRAKIVAKKLAEGLSFMGRDRLLQMKRGAYPKNPKTSERYSHRPRVLSKCPKRRAECLAWYFSVFFAYKAASREYRAGNLDVKFPEGTYKPFYWHKAPTIGMPPPSS
ncbi:MAG: hypothetical protein GYA55_11725 [SAR324 cluster bacterium]|uniref:Transposase IS200-like domain-containing protein n=1 Tax=SAR324 cluster bacterium TaxID=2024889 RepID=A0A7X9IK75_9DELT|nr:hypothetical protein [SAR324 cluster bacterium]